MFFFIPRPLGPSPALVQLAPLFPLSTWRCLALRASGTFVSNGEKLKKIIIPSTEYLSPLPIPYCARPEGQTKYQQSCVLKSRLLQ